MTRNHPKSQHRPKDYKGQRNPTTRWFKHTASKIVKKHPVPTPSFGDRTWYFAQTGVLWTPANSLPNGLFFRLSFRHIYCIFVDIWVLGWLSCDPIPSLWFLVLHLEKGWTCFCSSILQNPTGWNLFRESDGPSRQISAQNPATRPIGLPYQIEKWHRSLIK